MESICVCVCVCCAVVDLFSQHLDTELSEEDVQKITSHTKSKTSVMVLVFN